MRVACLRISHLRSKSETRRDPRLGKRPAVIVDRTGSGPVVVDHNPRALGVKVGMTLEQAVSHHADCVVVEADEPYYEQVFDEVLRSLIGIGPGVEGQELGVAYVRLDGLGALYGGENRLVKAILQVVPPDLEPSAGVGPAMFPAYVAARTAPALGAQWVPADVARFLSPHSIDLLPVSSEIKTGLHLLGLHTMGEVAALQKTLLVDRFGWEGLQVWSLCAGIDDRALVPTEIGETISEHTFFSHRSASLELFLVSVDMLLEKAFSRSQLLGRQVSGVTVECTCDRAPSWKRAVHFKQAVRRWEQAASIVRNQIEMDPPGAPIEEIRLTLSGLSSALGVQLGLWADPKRVKWRRIREVERKLRSKMAANHILYQVVEVAPWHPAPEMRSVLVPVSRSEMSVIKPVAPPTKVVVQEKGHHQPVSVLLGDRWHPIVGVIDRWTFDLWWLPTPIARTYYRLAGENGRLVTVFYDLNQDCWYQQGA